MQYKSRMHVVLLILASVLVVVIVFKISSAEGNSPGPVPQQDIIRLESRLAQLEQRFYTVETSVRTLEQQSRLSGVTSRISPEDLLRLQAELQTLQRRIIDDECSLAKLDERTLTAAMRDARRKAGIGNSDPCRNNFESPLRLPEDRP
ncbi:MAG TPA: hypothetical protein VJ875_09235 [Pyrinomonadaceae bacterium]|nr:hypothetical protein [Pyrinomonadaceae bacterium]